MPAPAPTPPPESSRDPRSSLDWPQHAGATAAVLDAVAAHVQHRRRRARVRLAAAATLACAAFFAWRFAPPATPPRLTASPTATVSVPARQTLPDGTLVELNDGAEITTDFSPTLRRVILRRGEAHFDVTKDPSRPFIVVAGKLEVRAIGTAFAVQLAPSAVDVLVTEGRVAVDRVQLPGAPPLAIVDAGRRTFVDTNDIAAASPPLPAVVPVTPAEVAARLTWRAPRLEFTATPLREVIAVFNAHSRVRLVLADDALAALPLSGLVRADNTPALLQLLHTHFGLTATERVPGEWVLQK